MYAYVRVRLLGDCCSQSYDEFCCIGINFPYFLTEAYMLYWRPFYVYFMISIDGCLVPFLSANHSVLYVAFPL